MVPNGYAQTQRETLSGRALEREVFTRITARLEAADVESVNGLSSFLSALTDNRRLWLNLATDLASPGNSCSNEVKASLLSIAAFVEAHTERVSRKKAGANVLVEINRNIIAGLSGSSAEAA